MRLAQIYLFILIVGIAACGRQKTEVLSDQILEIQQDNIPDKRLFYWDIELKTENNKRIIKGATVSAKAFEQLQTIAKEKKVGFEVDLLPANDFKENPWGVVTLSVCNIRGKAKHSAELVTQALMGTPVKVYTKVGAWLLVQTPDRYFGWVSEAGIALKTNAEMVEWKALEKVLFNKQNGFAYTEATLSGTVECDLVLADLLSISGEEKTYYKIVMADGREGFVKKDECCTLDFWKTKSLAIENILQTAYTYKGIPYLWGGTSPKMADCSGFTKTVYYYCGVILQRDASQQTLYGKLVDTEAGYDKLKAGDLVFFGKKATGLQGEKVTHVGLYLDNKEFIHASGKVRINSLDKESENYTEYYETSFVRARRVVGNIDGNGIEWVVDNEFYKQIFNFK